MPIRLYSSWRAAEVTPDGWVSLNPPGHVRKVPVNDPDVLNALKAELPGRWMKIYRYGTDGNEVHYFEHESGKVANVKMKWKAR